MKTLLLMKPNRVLWSCQVIALMALTLPRRAAAVDEQTFASPLEAVNAVVGTAKAHDTSALRSIFGEAGHELISPDSVQAAENFKLFAERLTQETRLITNSDSNMTLEIGAEHWPFPIPLVKQNGQWFFDVSAGKEEVLARRVGMNELGAIDVCHAYVEAQREYAGEDRLGDGAPAYAQFLRSSDRAHDGLFWPAKPGEELSPLGPFVAQARVEGYRRAAQMMSDELAPYHGYYFKILTRQGKHASGGKYNYVINGRMIAGFALIAWPAEWGDTGVMTFIVNQQGTVFEKNLGPKTVKIAGGITAFDPDDTWTSAR
jgi:hypothetical protein